MNLLGARMEPEKELAPIPQPAFTTVKVPASGSNPIPSSGKAEWTMDLPIANAAADLSSDEDN